MNKWNCILPRQMKLQQGQSITWRMLMLYLLCNYVLLVGTLAFTARQYCFKQQEQWRDQICLQAISHKLDSRSDIIFLNICQMVLLCSWLELLILFVYLFDFWNIVFFFHLKCALWSLSAQLFERSFFMNWKT